MSYPLILAIVLAQVAYGLIEDDYRLPEVLDEPTTHIEIGQADACSSFYDHVCSGNQTNFETTIVDDMRARVKQILTDDRLIPSGNNSNIINLRSFYKSCKQSGGKGKQIQCNLDLWSLTLHIMPHHVGNSRFVALTDISSTLVHFRSSPTAMHRLTN